MTHELPVLDTRAITMRWGDMDAVGHLNNTYYFRYLEQVRIDWLNGLGYGIEPEGIGPVLASTSCTFRKQLTYPATLDITIELEKLGRSSLKLRHHFYRQDDPGVIYASAEVLLVWVDYKAEQSVPIPDGIREAIERSLPAAGTD